MNKFIYLFVICMMPGCSIFEKNSEDGTISKINKAIELTPSASGYSAQLLSFSNVKRLGAFKLPGGDANFARGVIELNPDKNSFFMAGHEHRNHIAEYSIPSIISEITDLGDLPTATQLQNFQNIMQRASDGNSELIEKVGGLQLIKDSHGKTKLIGSGYEFYDTSGQTYTHFVVNDPDNLESTSVNGYFAIDGPARKQSGYMLELPQKWQQIFGKTHIVGQSSGLPIIGGLSVGPAAYAINLDELGNQSNPDTITLLEYDLSRTLNPGGETDLANDSGTNDIWTHLSRAAGAFVSGDTIGFLGNSGGHNDGIGYKSSISNPCGGTGGYGANNCDYEYHYWLYDLNDLKKVMDGNLQPYSVKPYEHGSFELPWAGNNGADGLGGVTTDPWTGYVYLTQLKSDSSQEWSSGPIVHVLDVSATSENVEEIPDNSDDVETSQLVASWNFDNDSNALATDLSGNGHHGTVNGALSDLGRTGKGLHFDGINDFVDLGSINVPNEAAGLTISAWFKADDFINGDARIISKSSDNQANDHDWMISTINSDGKIHLRTRLKTTEGGTVTLIGSGGSVSVNQWVHVVMQYDGQTLRLYQNGEEVGSTNKTGLLVRSGLNARIGANSNNYGFFHGIIDDVQIYNRALNTEEIQVLLTETVVENQEVLPSESEISSIETNSIVGHWSFDNDSSDLATDISGNGYHGAINGALYDSGQIGKGLHFDGINDFVDLGPIDVPDEVAGLTISAWFKADDFNNGDARIISKASGNQANDHDWMISTFNNDEKIHLRARLKTTEGGTVTLIGYGGSISANQWIHVVMQYDGQTLRLYQNDVEVGNTNKTGLLTSSGLNVRIGANPNNYGFFHGIIDDVQIHNRVLNSDEI